jgi:hypothetical protein
MCACGLPLANHSDLPFKICTNVSSWIFLSIKSENVPRLREASIMPVNDEGCWGWVGIVISGPSTKMRFHPIEESCERLSCAISNQRNPNKLDQFVFVNS